MDPLGKLITRSTVAGAMLALSILVGCRGDDAMSPRRIDGPPSTVEVAYCAGLEPAWVAFQDGDGAWTRAEPEFAGGKVIFRRAFTSDRGGMASARTFQRGLTSLSIEYGVPAELPSFGDTNPAHCGPVVSKTLLGTVAGLDTGDFAAVNAGFGSRDIVTPVGTGSNSFRLTALLSGPQEVLATHARLMTDGNSVLSGIILRRTADLPDGATLPVFDFDSPEAFAPAVANLTITGLGAEGAVSVTRVRTAHGENELSFFTSAEGVATRHFDAIPEAHLEPNDLQLIVVTANPNSTNVIRSAAVYFHAPTDQTIALGAPVPAPVLSTVSATPSLRLRARFGQQQDYDRITSMSYQQGENTVVTVGMTAAYAALIGGYDLTVPDLSTVAGFDARWALRAGEPVFWIADRIGGTLGLGFDAVPTSGATVRTGLTFDTFSP